MTQSLLIKNARIIDPGQNIDTSGDILISNGKVERIARSIDTTSGRNSKVLDAKGLVVCPGFVDLHCHLRDPGYEDKETIATGTKAAAAGGFTTICCMPNTLPALDSRSAIDYVKNKASDDAIVRILPIGCITKGRAGSELAEMHELVDAGVVAFSDDGNPVASSRLMYLAMQYSTACDVPIFEHCEDKELTNGGSMNEGWVSARLGLKGIPAESEEIAVSRNIALAKLTGARLHICHASTAGSVKLIRRAREDGIPVTAEATPHHLTLTEERVMRGQAADGSILAYDTSAKVNPPLRTEQDRQTLVQGLKEGVIDCVSTDHAPHTTVDKLCEFGLAAFGISGFETAFASLMKLVHDKELDLHTLLSALSFRPASIIAASVPDAGTLRAGARADIVLFDPDKKWTVDSRLFASKGKNTPYQGYQFKGKVMATLVAGNIAYRDATLDAIKNDR